MKPFSTPFARKSCDQSRHGGKVVKRSYISGSESESELDSVVGGKEASIEAEALVARMQGGKEAGGKGSVGGERKCCTLVARCSHDFLR